MRKDYTKPDKIIEKNTDKTYEGVAVESVTGTNKKKQKMFYSVPMNGRSEKDILADFERVRKMFSENYEIIDSYHQKEDPNGIDSRSGVWYLGHSLQLMRAADMVVFDKAWLGARGCIVEHRVCDYYNIPYIELRD